MRPLDSQRDPSSPADSNPPRPRQNYTERAFVIQFDPVEGSRCRLRGRAELIASGEQKRFRSLKELIAFMVGVLRNRSTPQD